MLLEEKEEEKEMKTVDPISFNNNDGTSFIILNLSEPSIYICIQQMLNKGYKAKEMVQKLRGQFKEYKFFIDAPEPKCVIRIQPKLKRRLRMLFR